MALDRDVQERDGRRESLASAEARFLKERAGVDRRERLSAWREWAAKKLLAEFTHWPADPAARAKQIGQCTAELETLVRHLFERGWLLEGKRLAQVASDCLAPIAVAQRAGKIGDFFPYYRAAVRRYVGANAEEMQGMARRDGADVAQSMAGILAGVIGRLQAPSITEVIAERPKQEPCTGAARGRPAKFKAAQSATLPLF
jgi:hypothetical protein